MTKFVRAFILHIALLAMVVGCATAVSTSEPTAPTTDSAANRPRSCEEGGACPAGTMVGYWRIVLERSADGVVTVLGHAHYDADAGAGVPLSSGAPTHAVLAYDAAGQTVASAPVGFAQTILLENIGSLESKKRRLERAVAMATLRAPESTARIVVVDGQMKELARIEGTALERQSLRRRTQDEPWAIGQMPRSTANWLAQIDPAVARARSSCPHVHILGAAPGDGGLAEAVRSVFDSEPAPPSRLQLEQMFSALQYLSPLQCRALRAIAFVSQPDHTSALGWQTSVSGGLVFLNAAAFTDEVLGNGTEHVSAARWRAEMQRTVVHEATHAVQELLDAGDREVDFQRNWPSQVRVEAREILDAHLFPKGNFLSEWIRTHRTFVQLGLAAEPWEKAMAKLKPTEATGEALATAGFMSRYGATAYHDDIAEMASHVQTQPLYERFPDSERRDWACKALSTMQQRDVPSKYSAVFAKLGFLKSLGVIEERRYDECVGKAKLPELGVGVHSVRGDGSKRSYNRNIQQSVQFVASKRGTYGRYQLLAEGLVKFGDREEPGQFRMEVSTGPKATELPPIPRGIYQVSGGWIGQRTRIKGEAAGHWGRFQVDLGWIVITEASRERMRGFIEVRKASRPTAFGAKVDNLPDRIFFDIPKDR